MSIMKKIALLTALVLIAGAFTGLIVHKTTGSSQTVVKHPTADVAPGGDSGTSHDAGKIYVLIEQGSFADLTPTVYENGQRVMPSDVYVDDHSSVRTFDVYNVTPGASTLVFDSVPTKGETKRNDTWAVDVLTPSLSLIDFYRLNEISEPGEVEIEDDFEYVVVFKHPS